MRHIERAIELLSFGGGVGPDRRDRRTTSRDVGPYSRTNSDEEPNCDNDQTFKLTVKERRQLKPFLDIEPNLYKIDLLPGRRFVFSAYQHVPSVTEGWQKWLDSLFEVKRQSIEECEYRLPKQCLSENLEETKTKIKFEKPFCFIMASSYGTITDEGTVVDRVDIYSMKPESLDTFLLKLQKALDMNDSLKSRKVTLSPAEKFSHRVYSKSGFEKFVNTDQTHRTWLYKEYGDDLSQIEIPKLQVVSTS